MGDYISREETIEKLLKGFWDDKKTLRQCINEIPPADVRENRRGEWRLKAEQKHVELTYECSECGNEAWGEYEKTPYCPMCGSYNGTDIDKEKG